MGRAFNTNWGEDSAYSLLVGKSEGKRPLGRPICSLVDNIKMGLGEIEWNGVDLIGLTQDLDKWRAFLSVINLQVP
jgi:hypothetical protein